jgi:hypothetical protein
MSEPFSFPIPRWGERDPHFAETRPFWIEVAVPGRKRPNPPVKSFRAIGPGRGRRLIDYASAKAYMAKLRDSQLPEAA